MMVKRPLIGPSYGGEYKPLWPLVLGCLPWAALVAAYLVLRRIPGAAQAVVSRFSFPARQALAGLSAHVRFSIMEVLYVLFALLVLWFLVRSVHVLRRGHRKGRIFARRALIILLVALCMLAIYGWMWGLDYYTGGITAQTSLTGRAAAQAEVEELAAWFLDRANTLAAQMPRDENGSCIVDTDALFDAAPALYDGLRQEFPCLDVTCFRPKPMFFSKFMSLTGFTGVYYPYTGESNINMDAPGCLTGSVVAHELAHQAGFAAEQEANFLGIAACIASGRTDYSYAGTLSGLIHTMNALARTNPDLWQSLRGRFSPELAHDWQENAGYWDRYDTFIDTLYTKVYDKYLKANGQTLGTASYGACVNLLAEYFLPIIRAKA